MRCWRVPLSDKGSWLISARRGYVDLILALMDADEDLRPQYADLYSKIVYDLTNRDKFTFNALYAWDDNFINEDNDAEDLNSSYQNAMFWTKWRHFYSESIWSDLFVFNNLAIRDRREGIDGVDKRDVGFLGAKGGIDCKPARHPTQFRADWNGVGPERNTIILFFSRFNRNHNAVYLEPLCTLQSSTQK